MAFAGGWQGRIAVLMLPEKLRVALIMYYDALFAVRRRQARSVQACPPVRKDGLSPLRQL